MTTSRRLHSIPMDDELLQVYLAQPWNPFEAELPNQEVFPSHLMFKADWPIGLFIMAMLVADRNKPLPSHIRQGLPDVAAFHFGLPLSHLTQHVLQDDEGDVRILGVVQAERRLKLAEQVINNDRERERRIGIAQASIERDGAHRWKAYLTAVLAIRRFASHAGVPTSVLPDDPTSRLRPSQGNPVARRVLTPDEMDAVWNAVASFRDSALATLVLNFVRETAARRQSVIDLRLKDVCWEDSCVWLQTKGHNVHRQVVSKHMMERIAVRALERRWDGNDKGNPRRCATWRDDSGIRAFRRDDGSPLTIRWFESLYDHIDGLVQFEDGTRFTLHYLRHTTIAQIERVAGYAPAQQFAGHRVGGSGETRGSATSIYIRWSLDDWKFLFKYLFPGTRPGRVDVQGLKEKVGWLKEEGLEF